jgi:type VI secretion system protein ImpK
MSDDNPFASEGEKTVIRPNPGGRRPAAPAPASPFGPAASPPSFSPAAAPVAPQPSQAYAPPPMPMPSDAPDLGAIAAFGLNPLVAAAQPILALAARLRTMPSYPDLEGLRARIGREIQEFHRRISNAGMQPEQMRAGHYALCATIDDVVMNTPWGAAAWARQSMTSVFHNEVTGGERFFELLAQAHKEAGRFGDVLELMYVCLSLGFEGRMRVVSRGAHELARIREGIYSTIRQRRGEFERELAPHWRGISAPHRPLSSFLPGWVVALATAAVLALGYFGFNYALNSRSDAIYERLALLPPVGKVGLKPAIPAPPPVVAAGPSRLRTFLEPEIREGLVTLEETPRRAMIRLRAGDMFDSGSATVNAKLTPVLDRIGKALDDEPGAVLVVGHSDNTPIRSARFPSNFHLSTARAEAVRDLIKKTLKAPQRITAEGRADAEPIASNATAEGRAQNRRIEVVLTRDAAQ